MLCKMSWPFGNRRSKFSGNNYVFMAQDRNKMLKWEINAKAWQENYEKLRI